jgi:hypothetical protein
MDGSFYAIALSLGLLGIALAGLSARALARFLRKPEPTQGMWAAGMGMAAAAMGIETVVYVGVVSSGLLEAYVFVSAALVGLLSLGCTHVIRVVGFPKAYGAFILAACAVLAAACALTPLPLSMVSNGIIWQSPPLTLLILSSIITGPATIVLLAASVVSLRRSRKWQNLLIIGGALVLGAGGTLYIASFPVFLYYAEFIGIVLLFGGVVSLPRPSPSAAGLGRPAGMGQ